MDDLPPGWRLKEPTPFDAPDAPAQYVGGAIGAMRARTPEGAWAAWENASGMTREEYQNMKDCERAIGELQRHMDSGEFYGFSVWPSTDGYACTIGVKDGSIDYAGKTPQQAMLRSLVIGEEH